MIKSLYLRFLIHIKSFNDDESGLSGCAIAIIVILILVTIGAFIILPQLIQSLIFPKDAPNPLSADRFLIE